MKKLFKFFKKKSPRLEISEHYALLSGSLFFDAQWYLQVYPDVAQAGADPVLHYLNHGASEGREPCAEFDSVYYLSQINALPAELSQVTNPLLHFLTVGQLNGLSPVPPSGLEGVSLVESSGLNQGSVLADVAIIIPVYNALNDLKACLQSVLRFTFFPARVILIDDASSDLEIAPFLQQFLRHEFVEVYRNEVNLGFSGTVNRGLALAGKADVVLLNADTVVSPGWLGRLREAAYREPQIGTVTPISNNAGAFSVPEAGTNVLPEGLNPEQTGRLFAQNGCNDLAIVPTGNGFCLYIKRPCLAAVGMFDAEAFPKGYGEENDFCMRALQKGWTHVIDATTWIYHVRSASFGETKTDLMQAGRKIVEQRFPQYSALVHRAFSGSAVLENRSHAAHLYAAPQDGKTLLRPRVLYVLSTLTGGTPQTNQDLMLALARHIDAYVLHCDSCTLRLKRFHAGHYQELARVVLPEQIHGAIHLSDAYDQVVKAWLKKWAIELVHIRHIAWHSLGLVDVTRSLGVPCLFSFHDFYTVCPTVKLLDNNGRYCAGFCSSDGGRCEHELWPEAAFTSLKHHQVKPWKRMFSAFLQKCDGFVTTNLEAKNLLLLYYPALMTKPFEVIEHGRDFMEFKRLARAITDQKTVRLLILGNISSAKGGGLVQELAKIVLPSEIEIHILGNVSPAMKLPKSVICHGAYQRDDLSRWIDVIQPNLGAVLSIWPETWCHTLTEYWAHGIPVVGFDMGAVGQRLKQSKAGWILKDRTAIALKKAILSITEQDWQEKALAVVHWQQTDGVTQNREQMAKQYWALYQASWMPLEKKVPLMVST